jgi:DNA invertase Pin-like site-specific DNA recombinase
LTCGDAIRPSQSSGVRGLLRLRESSHHVGSSGAIADELTQRQVRLNLGGSVYDPNDPVRRLLFNVLAMVAEFSNAT